MEEKKHKTIVYRYYDYLQENHFGKENGIKRQELAEIMGVPLNTQKKILREINESDDFHKLVSTCGSIYMCKTKDEVDLAICNTWNNALTLLNKVRKMTNKMTKNGQYQIKTGKYYKDVISVFE